LPIDNKMKAALCRDANSEYLPLLQLAQCVEEARWTDAEAKSQQLGLDGSLVIAAFQKSIEWVGEMGSLRADSATDEQCAFSVAQTS
jgi:c-di-GMP phosphodiesterase